jgi:NAD(P)-dependent dehydrogenase (short-subunit alcohol dehydrogenase family)
MRLEGKTVLVTGAARGIGAAIASACLREGAIVWSTDLWSLPAGELLPDPPADGPPLYRRRLDVRLEAQWEAVIGEVLSVCGRLDVVVNNAGITGFEAGLVPHDPENASLADWRAVHETNLDGGVSRLQARHPRHAPEPRRLDHQHILPLRSGRHTRGRGLCVLEGGDPQSYANGGTLLRRAGPRYPLQFHPSGRHSDADVGSRCWAMGRTG